MANKKELVVTMPNRIPKGKVDKFEVDDPKTSSAAVKNVYVSHAGLKALGNPDELEIVIRPKA